jgi:DNA-binding transcriptional MerR regulator
VTDREMLMPIGRFARACRLGVKALRHYDEEGLLRPAFVDADTGYRYYARSQARPAVTIAMLRSLGVGLASIRTILAAGPRERARLLAAESERQRAELIQREHALRAVERLAAADDLMPYAIALRRETSLLVAQRSVITTPDALVADSTAAIHALLAELRESGRTPRMPVLCVNEAPDAEERILVNACAAVDAREPRLARSRVVELPGGDFASLTHRGSYEELGLAHHALYAWAQERGHEAAGAIREIYANDPAHVAREDLVTEVLLPVA